MKLFRSNNRRKAQDLPRPSSPPPGETCQEGACIRGEGYDKVPTAIVRPVGGQQRKTGPLAALLNRRRKSLPPALFLGIGTVVLTGALSACSSPSPNALPGTSTTTGHSAPSPSGPSTSAYGKYVGTGGGASLTISFNASASGIENLNGDALLVCTQTTGNSVPYGVGSKISFTGPNSFSSDTTSSLSSGGTAELKVTGTLDGSGHASGTLSYSLANQCDTGTIPITWNAALGGSGVSTDQSASSACSPRPCQTSGGLTLDVTGLIHVPTATPAPCDPSQQICADPSPTPDLVEATFMVTNNDTKAHVLSGATDQYGLQPGNGATINDNDVSSLGTLPDGTACRGDDTSLQPGAQSPTLHTCFLLTDAQLTGPFKFVWSIDTGGPPAGGTIDLSGMTIR